MKTLIQGGHLVDPSREVDRLEDIWIDGDRIIDGASLRPQDADVVIDATDCVVMAGGIDIHTHIGGGKLAIARMLLDDVLQASARSAQEPAGESAFLPVAAVAAKRYLEMGYTVGFEPAMLPTNARAAHSEMNDMPALATGGYCILGNDDVLLSMIADQLPQSLINDYVAWMVKATQAIAVKVVNPGGISAFKFGLREFDVDTPHPRYGVTPAQIIRVLARATHEIGLVHPLHVHCSNLGVPGNIASTLATIEAADGLPIHLTHVQFHCYGNEGPYRMSSAAEQLVAALNRHPNVTVDVGQVMFGQTVTISADSMHQHANRKRATPRKTALVDIECEAGCGVVPFRYRRRRFVHSLQWAIGLELFLTIDDPARVFLTTDHPNGAPFTAYPHLIRLLGDRSFRETALAEIHPDAAAASSLAGIDREYLVHEIATMTRSGPASILGLADRGHLAAGAIADLALYRRDDQNLEKMFRSPEHVFVRGQHVIDSTSSDRLRAVASDRSKLPPQTLTADLVSNPESVDGFAERFQQRSCFDLRRLWISDDELHSVIGSEPVKQFSRGRER
ncbi:formylmethanofuran dehydrogenase subunit A [Roseiconus nitratireducens]|uniref:Formylmethanofuran dehydrogenase subunit A n=1 Tax=Roseiconus nitratireducens TaxID=2605748 RepID=A0A5M6DL76_9BACT|nr:formylmethanofuran dehydrogenase subunit A [Roseiconus nitratireducens]KAA5547156.1 formylmethanofuran dehydrogenase subunit A [Roseiconus nitratireducens]